MVDLLVGLTKDDYSQVASLSRASLQKLSRRLENGPCSLNVLLEENLHLALTALPHVMRAADDANKIQSLNLVHGYMNLLGNRLGSLLNSSSHLKRLLSLALLQVTVTAFKDFASVDPELIWLSLNDLYCPGELTCSPPHETFKHVKLAGTGPQSKEYAENVTILLSMI